MVFAAGFGKRLRPLTDRVPKPLVPVANRPLMGFALAHLGRFGVTQVVVNAHHLADQVVAALPGLLPAGMAGQVVVEHPAILGTGGGLKNAWRGRLSGPGAVIVVNGDILFAPDLAGALALHERTGAVATLVLRPDPRAAFLGPVDLDAGGRVRRLLGAPGPAVSSLRTLMFTGVHILSARAFDDLPEDGCIIRSSYRKWVDSGDVVAGFVDESPWGDLGTISDYWQANLDLATGARRWPGVMPSDTVIAGVSSDIGHGAQVIRTVLGDGAMVAPGVHVADAVVWPGAVVNADVRRAIVLPDQVVPVP